MTLYEGRLNLPVSELMDALNRSLPVDIRLLPYDVAVNRAWASELGRIGVFSAEEVANVERELDALLKEFHAGAFDVLPDDEDVHTLVERFLTERLDETGAKIHTGRSRNDQVATDLRLYVMDALSGLMDDVAALVRVLRDPIETHAATLLAGTTHLQPAQPITLGHFLSSLAAALLRDFDRLADARHRAALCPLGCGALAGSGFKVDRKKLANALGFENVLPNSLDAIADRDAAQETASACAILVTHLSRYAEQFVFWSHPSFGYLRFSDRWSTGSSMMPQKRNPDAMELVRGKAARVIGQSTALLTLTKGVPLSYAKDLQEDKQALFDAVDTTKLVVRVMTEALVDVTFFPENMARTLSGDMLATDLADRLVEAGVPFRAAHGEVARWVAELEQSGRNSLDTDLEERQKRFPQLSPEALALDFEASIRHRDVQGGAAPNRVLEFVKQLDDWLERIAEPTINAN